MRLEIRQYGDPILRAKGKTVAKIDGEILKLAEDMIETMRANAGCGLAAQQIGRDIMLCVIESPEDLDKDEAGTPYNPGLKMPMVVINPEIVTQSKKTESREEGCLSFPDIRGNIDRAREITLTFLNEKGEPQELQVRGFTARVLQHEIDHLNGVLFIDRMSYAKQIAIKGKLKRMRQETEERMNG